MLWDKIKGQTGAVNYLRRSISKDKIVSGYLFQGPSGVGKEMTAAIFAGALNCRSAPGDGCGSCPECRQIEIGAHPDVHFIAPYSKSRKIVIEQIEEMRKLVYLRSYGDNWKVFIIKEADRLNISAQNAFLKTLEEPPEKTIMILITDQPGYLLSTTLSRCQRVIFNPWSLEMMKSFLREKTGITESESHVLYGISGGCPGRALELVEEGILEIRKKLFAPLLEERISSAEKISEQVKSWLDYISERGKELGGELEKERDKWQEALASSERKSLEERDESRVAAAERTELEMIFKLIFSWIRDLFVYRQTGGEDYIINRDYFDEIRTSSHRRSLSQLRKMMKWVEDSRLLAEKTSARATRQLIFENMLIQLGYWRRTISPGN